MAADASRIGGPNWKLALDVAPIRERPTGVGVYAASLALALVEAIPSELVLIGRRDEWRGDGEWADGVAATPFRGPNYHGWLQLHANADAVRAGARLVHYTNASAPMISSRPYVLTVHDLSLLRMPGSHPKKRLVTLPLSLAAIGRARAIIVPSEATRRDLTRLGMPGRRIAVIGHAPSGELIAAAETEPLPERFGLTPGCYILAVGTLEPRKNYLRLVTAFDALARANPRLKLVIVGERGWHSEPIFRHIASSAASERIVMTGYIPTRELAALIRDSAALCYVSLHEGFGLPIVEAMAVGAAVVTSRKSSMPEVAAGAAVLVDPGDARQIALGIERAMAEHDRLTAAGRARTNARTWGDVALETIDVYRWVEKRSGRPARGSVTER